MENIYLSSLFFFGCVFKKEKSGGGVFIKDLTWRKEQWNSFLALPVMFSLWQRDIDNSALWKEE